MKSRPGRQRNVLVYLEERIVLLNNLLFETFINYKVHEGHEEIDI